MISAKISDVNKDNARVKEDSLQGSLKPVDEGVGERFRYKASEISNG